MLSILFVLIIVHPAIITALAWDHEIDPGVIIEEHPASKVNSFVRNNTPHEALRILHIADQWALVGGKDVLYNLSLPDLQLTANITWNSINLSNIRCKTQTADAKPCSNYIRIAIPVSADDLMVCGSHSSAPLCRHYINKDGQYSVKVEFDAKNMAPLDQDHQVASLFINDKLFTGVSAHPNQKHPVLIRQPLRTKFNNVKQLNMDAQFVGGFTQKEYAYFFLGESPLEFDGCGTEQLRGTVARVCVEDPGAPTPNNEMWSTFIKARLRCSLNGTLPFDFNNIRGISKPVVTDSGKTVVYAIFASADTAAQASAVCVYTLDDINKALNGGPNLLFDRSLYSSGYFKSLRDDDASLGSCGPKTKHAANKTQYLETHDPLVETEVQSLFNDPILLHLGFDYHYTAIAIDSSIKSLDDNRTLDVMFVGTSHGHVIKATNLNGYRSSRPYAIEDIIVFKDGSPVTGVHVHKTQKTNTTQEKSMLIVESKQFVRTVPLDNCDWIVKTCSKCVALQDPYCAWDKLARRCINVDRLTDKNAGVQNLISGYSLECPNEPKKPPTQAKANKHHDIMRVGPNGPIQDGEEAVQKSYTKKSLVIVGAISFLISSIFGFGAGFLYSQRQKRDLSYFNYR